MSEELDIKRGEFYLGDEKREGIFTILFQGAWGILSDAFIAGGIVKSRWEDEGKGTAVLYHDDDENEMK